MGYLIKAAIGVVLFVGGIALANVKLVQLLEVGTCAEGNIPYEVAQPCPDGTSTAVFVMMGSILAAIAGMVVFAFRGDPPRGERTIRSPMGSFNYGLFAWGVAFTATGASALLAVFTNDAIGPDGELGGGIVGVTFLLMGVPALAYAVWGLARSIGRARKAALTPRAPG